MRAVDLQPRHSESSSRQRPDGPRERQRIGNFGGRVLVLVLVLVLVFVFVLVLDLDLVFVLLVPAHVPVSVSVSVPVLVPFLPQGWPQCLRLGPSREDICAAGALHSYPLD